MSARAPAASANKNIGNVEATCTSDTIRGSGFKLTINQPEAALYIQVPRLEINVAVQITANVRCRNAPQGERLRNVFPLEDCSLASRDGSFSSGGCLSVKPVGSPPELLQKPARRDASAYASRQVSVFLDPDSVFCFTLRSRRPGGLIHLIELGLLDTFFNEPFIVASPLVVLILARTDRNFAAL